MRIVFTAILMISAVSFSEMATQTDWSGGSGVAGPVTDWGNCYDIASQINDTGGSLCLMSAILTNPQEHTVGVAFNAASSVCAADVDGDGDTDVLGTARNIDEITWWENTDGIGTEWTEHTVDDSFDGANSIYAADVDGDGDTDVLGGALFTDGVTWWENSDTGQGIYWTEHIVDDSFWGAYSVYAADVDGDGDTDVLGAAYYDDEITWWENTDGIGTEWTEHIVDGSLDGAHSVCAADLNGDGDTDVLGTAYNDDEIIWWENTDGTGTDWTEHTVDGSFDGAVSVYATDVDGDGDTDVLGAAHMSDDIAWWENTDGTGTEWTKHTVDDSFDGPNSVYAADIDGDGDTDVLGAAVYIDEVTWWENTDGTGTEWTEHTVDGSFDGSASVYAADINGDGDTDVLGAAFYAGEIAWWQVIGCSPAGTLESSILDAGTVDSWELFESNQQLPAGTSMGFQFRSSLDSAGMGAWSDTVFTASTSLAGILADSTDFLQYRVILQTTDPISTPILNDVSFTYTTYVSIGDTNPCEITCWGFEPHANPSFGNLAVLVSSPQSATVDLLLYDLTGRLIAEYSQELPSGEHSVYFNNLSEGVYFCTMHAEDFTATERIVVLK